MRNSKFSEGSCSVAVTFSRTSMGSLMQMVSSYLFLRCRMMIFIYEVKLNRSNEIGRRWLENILKLGE